MKRPEQPSNGKFAVSVLSSQLFDRLQGLADQFANARTQGPVADWTIYLPPPGDDLRQPVLHELISIDLDATWKDGKKPLLEDYVSRFPELGGPVGLPIKLIAEEFRVRMRYGGMPPLDEYYGRFPSQAPELQTALEQAMAPTRARGSLSHSVSASILPAIGSHIVPFSGSFRLIEPIGRGTFGEVWRGETPSGVPIAIKVLNRPSDDEQAKREIQSLELVKRLRHPCLLGTLDYWTHENRLYVALELADGTLRDLLRKYSQQGKSGIPPAELLEYFRDAADGLDYLHSQKVLHRDVKPDNILLHHGHAKLADFGLARSHTHSVTNASFAGTPLFMAPEIFEGKATAKSDQYSLAFAYAELRLGRRPLSGGDIYEIMKNTLECEPNLDGMALAEAQVVRRALSKFPEQRFDSCKEFVETLHEAIRTGNVPAILSSRSAPAVLRPAATVAKPAAPSPRASLPAPVHHSRRRLILLVLAVGLVAALVGFGLPVNRKPEQRPDLSSNQVTIDGRVYASRMELRLPNGDTAPFVLLSPGADSNIKPFYLMQTKVSNAVYDEYSNQTRFFGKWRRTKRAQNLPVFEIDVEEAHECAVWMGGRLPSPLELEFAAGFPAWQGTRPGPDAGPNIAINLQEPWPVSNPHDDVSPLGIFQLASNGREFTRWVTRGSSGFVSDETSVRFVPLPRTTVERDSDKVVLRGWGFNATHRLTYDDIASPESMRPMVQGYGQRDGFTTFRVVIELKDAKPLP